MPVHAPGLRAALHRRAPARSLTCRLAPCTRARQQLWLAVLLLAMGFSALQGLLGATVVTALADSGPVVEICTPQGMRWVPVSEADRGGARWESGAGNDADDLPASLRGLAQPCAWALAHVSVPPAPRSDERSPPPTPARLALPRPDALAPLLPDATGWILLTAPMRAPPARAA